MLRAGDQIGSYKLMRKLGSGTFGVVWLAERSTPLAVTQVAIKIPLDDEIDLDAVRQEASIWVAAGGHGNVLPLIEANIYDDYIVIASEYAPDGSLSDWLKKYGGRAPSVEAAVEMTRGILAGLAHLHARRIIHRDLKPANILLQGEMPRITDFGIARVLQSTEHSRVIAGTFPYMAPEAFHAVRDERTDIWSVGVILYQMLAGRRPFIAVDSPSLMDAIRSNEPDYLPMDIPGWLQGVVAKALTKDRKQRFQSAREMRVNLSPKAGERHIPYVWDDAPEPVSVEPLSVATVLRSSFREDIDGVKLDMILVPGGTFLMGSPDSEPERGNNEGPQHVVKVPSFYIGKYEITQAQWRAVMENNPSGFTGEDTLPVDSISWNDAKEFCRKLSQLTGKAYRLPSEAEWEYACRAGTTTSFSFGSSLSSDQANFDGNYPYGGAAKGVDRQKPTRVGSFQPNDFGIYDMHGNLYELCEDVYHDSYGGQRGNPPSDGSAWITEEHQNSEGVERVKRGGSWAFDADYCRSAYRGGVESGSHSANVGLRVVVSARTQ